MGNYRRHKIWNRGHALALRVYRITRTFPSEEKYGPSAQLRRASVSSSQISPKAQEGRAIGSKCAFCGLPEVLFMSSSANSSSLETWDIFNLLTGLISTIEPKRSAR